MYILMLTRNYHQARDNFSRGHFFEPEGKSIGGMTLGIIGFGASGRQLARRARAFGMRVEAVDVRPLEADLSEDLRPDFFGTPDDMDALISRSDVLSLHLHLTPETKHIINARCAGPPSFGTFRAGHRSRSVSWSLVQRQQPFTKSA